MRVAVLGCGRWGSFLAWYAQRMGHEVMIWGRENSKTYENLCQSRQNEYLHLPENISFTNSLAEAVQFAEVIIISISAQALRSLGQRLSGLADLDSKTFVLCMKGLEIGTGKRLSVVLRESLGDSSRIGVWVGPGHVQDFLRGVPNCMVIGSDNRAVSDLIIKEFGGDLIRFYYGTDLLGIEIGAAAKNVVGIAAGMLDGLSYGSLKGALMARGTRELSRLVEAIGGDAMTVYGLSHLGDYEATLFSPHSNNRKFGEGFVKGERFDKLAEGVATVEALICLADKSGLELPICQVVYDIVCKGKSPKQQLLELFLRPVKSE